ncbi:hypothetical protein E2P61_01820 [Candidatus Bathyarchaeota archaeon]|nr:hypothetical protein E2P61_01820 [Candidatus Bathyarchaeota archaeon]
MSKLKNADFRELAPVFFYGSVGILLIVLLPFANFPPHIGLTGALSLVTAYGILKNRFWAFWLVIALLAVATTISLYTLSVVAFTNWIVAISMISYAVLTWIFTLHLALKRNPA